MNLCKRKGLFRLAAAGLLLALAGGLIAKPPERAESITLVVMDPLAKELACACVKGFGQRDYRKLARHLESNLKRRVAIEFSDDLADSLAVIGANQPMIVVGDRALVAHGSRQGGLKCRPVCELSDREGETTLGALFVVRSGDSARELRDIGGRPVYFGFPETDGKYDSAMAALRTAGIDRQIKAEQRGAYSDAALDVVDSQGASSPVAVIPGYALRLLEGCGSITPGNLKVIGKSDPVPFITVFLSDNIPAETQTKIVNTLLAMKQDAKLLELMESRDGFKRLDNIKSERPKPSASMDWPDWRGPRRDGRVAKLPIRLPEQLKFVWKKAAMPDCLAGLSLGNGRLILAERDFGDEHDIYRCLDANTGELLWLADFPAIGVLDYGQSPRATPVIHNERAYLLGAFGDLRCVDVNDGKLVWERHLPKEFETEVPTWGMCSTPLIVDDKLIVNPGASNASLVALDLLTGKTLWTAPGQPPAYAAFIVGEFGGKRQIVGYDEESLGGWDPKTGERLWELKPPVRGDFNVPTPVAVEDGLVVATENNGTRLYRFDKSGRIIPKPVAEYADLSPDTATPVVSSGRVFGTHHGLHCLDLKNGLKPVWKNDDDIWGDYNSLMADDERVLVVTMSGELVLLEGRAERCSIISRLRVFEDDVEVYSHAALVGTRLYIRGGSTVACLDLTVN